MLVTTNHWLLPGMVNGTSNEIHFNNNSQFSPYIEPMWASLSLVTSK
jgi:hypothetical protein